MRGNGEVEKCLSDEDSSGSGQIGRDERIVLQHEFVPMKLQARKAQNDPAPRTRFGWPLVAVLAIGITVYFGGLNALAKAAIPAAVGLVFGLARRFLPARPLADSLSPYSLAALNERFRNTQWIVGFGMVVIGIVFFWLTHLALVALNRGLAASEGPAYLLLSPQTAIWWFFPGFGALSLSWELTLVIWSTIGNQKEADLYDAWSSRKAGFDSRRVLRLMALFIAAPIGLLTCLALPIHDTLHDGEIRTTGFAWRNRSVYRYSDARRLTMIEGFRTRDGKLTRRAGLVVDFADGRRWSSADSGDFKNLVDPALLDFLQQKTRLPVQHTETEADIGS